MPELKEYKYHELANIFDLMEGEEFESFVADIEKYGLLEPIVLFEGQILDGRNRYRACQKLGISAKYKNLPKGMSAKDFVRSENYHRRHLTIAQKAELGLIWEKELAEEIKKKESLRKKGLSQKKESPQHSSKIAAKREGIGNVTLGKAKAIKKIAEKENYIADEWEKAKKGKTSVDAVYQKAKIIENLSNIPNVSAPFKHKIRAELESGDKSIKDIKLEIQDKKDNLKRAEITKRNRDLEKKQEQMDKLYLKINKLQDTIYELEIASKSSKARLTIFSKESNEKYPNIKSNDPDFVVSFLDKQYDTLDIKPCLNQLKKIRIEYDKLEKPLRNKLSKIESERKTKNDVVNKRKAELSSESVWIETQQELMLSEYDKQELYEENITTYKKELKELQEKYDN